MYCIVERDMVQLRRYGCTTEPDEKHYKLAAYLIWREVQ